MPHAVLEVPNHTELAAMIDHTALKPECSMKDIEKLCHEAISLKCASVCVNPVYVPMVSRVLEGTTVKTCSVVGFPLGSNTTAQKVHEAREAMRMGAKEIDMVIWVGGLKAGHTEWVGEDIAEVARACRDNHAILKVILECCLLTDEEKRQASELCVQAKANFIKTSTGFGPGGATVEDVQLLSSIAKPAGLGVKAAGGIRTYADALRMIHAGATRIGASSSVRIIEEAKAAGA
ncbi:MAG TPA: deoxyribose-phosphate aldolase [bacterium]|jgi:deoxyribose-phosphate aldolase